MVAHRDSNRPRRVGALLKRELSDLIAREVNDPNVGKVTITAVEVASDLKNAKVYFTCWQDDDNHQKTLAGLIRARGFLRHCLRDRVDLRAIPSLHFVYDESIERGNRISKLIDDSLKDGAGNVTENKPGAEEDET
ncbi:MAG: 30S ribosome-binding factor RbfA [Acidiferrobacterales bacterium]